MFFEQFVGFRMTTDDFKTIKKIVRKDQEKYDNESHFVRCAVLRLMREEKKRLNLK